MLYFPEKDKAYIQQSVSYLENSQILNITKSLDWLDNNPFSSLFRDIYMKPAQS